MKLRVMGCNGRDKLNHTAWERMEWKMKKIKHYVENRIWNKTALVTALVHFIISFFTDRLIFQYTWMDFSTPLTAVKSLETIVVKIVFLVLLIFLWQGLFYFVKRADRQFKILALSYFLLMLVLLLLTWPGIWRMDEFGLLTSSLQLYPHWWQNYITSVWYIFSLMLFPFPAGVVLTLIITASLLIARCICNACVILRHDFYGGKDRMEQKNAGNSAQRGPIWLIYLLLIPFLFFPVLDSNLYPMRMSLYAYLELTLLSELYLLYKRIQWHKSQGEIFMCPKEHTAGLIVLAVLVTLWRTEAIYYVVAFPLLLALIGGLKRYWKGIIIYIMLVVILFVPQKVGEKITSGQQYQLTSVVLPLVPLVLRAQSDGEEELLSEINLVVDTSVIEKAAGEGKNGINMFWSEPEFQREYSPEDFARFQSAYRKLILTYPTVFLQERWETFLSSTDLLENTTELFVKKEVPNYDTFGNYFLSRPISNDLRTIVIKTLEIRKWENYEEKLALTDWIYSAIPAIVILMTTSVVLLLRKKWIPAVILLTALAKAPLVFLTAPSRLFMYYYSVYLIGFVVFFYIIGRHLLRLRRQSEEKTWDM